MLFPEIPVGQILNKGVGRGPTRLGGLECPLMWLWPPGELGQAVEVWDVRPGAKLFGGWPGRVGAAGSFPGAKTGGGEVVP